MGNELTNQLLTACKAIQPFLGDILSLGDREKRATLIEEFDIAVEQLSNEYSGGKND